MKGSVRYWIFQSTTDLAGTFQVRSLQQRQNLRLKRRSRERLLISAFKVHASSASNFLNVRSSPMQVEIASSALLLVLQGLVVIIDSTCPRSGVKSFSAASNAGFSGYQVFYFLCDDSFTMLAWIRRELFLTLWVFQTPTTKEHQINIYIGCAASILTRRSRSGYSLSIRCNFQHCWDVCR